MIPKIFIYLITATLSLVAYSISVDESELILKNNLWFKNNADSPFTGTVYRMMKNEKKIIGKLFRGKKVEYWEEINIFIKTEGNYKNGKKEGEWIGWYHNGKHGYKGSYLNGEKEGEWIGWYENGQQSYKGKYNNGQKQSHWIYYYDGGQKSDEGQYFNDFEDGLWIYWYENGMKKYEKIFKNGELVFMKCWDESKNELDCK